MDTNVLRIICVEFENLNHFEQGRFYVDFTATDRVMKNSELYKVSGNIFSQSLIGFIGLNATGKTTALRLLKIALNIVIYNQDLNLLGLNDVIASGTVLRITFFYQGFYYQLEAIIESKKNKFYYSEEILKKKTANSIKSRKDVTNFSDELCIEKSKRSDLTSNDKKYLDDGKSFINPVIKDNSSYVFDNLWLNYINMAYSSGDTPSEILEVFDESIETLTIEEPSSSDNSSKWLLKFKDSNIKYNGSNAIALNLLISTGTIRGQELIQRAIEALKSGGYLIVDELEMHLNKEILKVILNLFKSKDTNPRGACLIFSSHYAEILDIQSMNRKDNIYITRKKNHLMTVSKFSDEFSRNDFKKSDIILSNALGGTAPKYESIKKLRDYICRML